MSDAQDSARYHVQPLLTNIEKDTVFFGSFYYTSEVTPEGSETIYSAT
jgi:hypothetical protein